MESIRWDHPRIDVCDEDPAIRGELEALLKPRGYHVVTFSVAAAALQRAVDDPPHLLVLSVGRPGEGGFDTARRLRAELPCLPVILTAAQPTMESTILATQLGAFDSHHKPINPAALLRSIEHALRLVRLMESVVQSAPVHAAPGPDSLIGQSACMQNVYKVVGRVAATGATVLIRGESGTGKELIARAIHRHSPRSGRPLVVINCAALPESLLESELFGHERGAFTGAREKRIGRFEEADGGTIFLDEIGDVPPGVQVKILRILQERTFERIGGNATSHTDVRLVAATHRNLERGILDGTFREDLFHRLNVVPVTVPPLRERIDDIPSLAEFFLDRFAAELGVGRPHLCSEALHALQNHRWPGNVRELEHAIYRTLIFTRGYPIQESDVLHALESADHHTSRQRQLQFRLQGLVRDHLAAEPGDAHEGLLQMLDRLLIAEALHKAGGNQTRAARLLGLSRPTFHAKLSRHGLRTETVAKPAGRDSAGLKLGRPPSESR